MMTRTTLIDCFPKWADTDGGIFKALYAAYGEQHEWLEHYAVFDVEYYGNRSGCKDTSPLIDRYITMNIVSHADDPRVMTSAQIAQLAAICGTRYANKWTRLYAAAQAEYEPIENYSMIETETPNLSHKHSVSDDYKDMTERKTSTDMTTTSDTDADASVYGFNSNSPVPSNTSGGQTTSNTTGEADDNTEHTEHTQSGYTEDTETGTRTLTRSGNIGVTTSQQMLESEIALWQWEFIEQVYKDIDKVLTSPVYR